MESAHQAGHEVTSVEVPGGRLAVETFMSGTEPVLAIHGVSSQRRLWNWLRAAAPGLSLVAPDLRGRGDSVGVRGASSMGRHAADMIAILDHLGLGAVHVCGMSMGGFVAVELATTYPGRVKSLILVDGGFPMAPPAGVTLEAMPALIADDRLARLDEDWPSLRDYAVYFAARAAARPARPAAARLPRPRPGWTARPARLQGPVRGHHRHLLRVLEVAAAPGARPAPHRRVEH
jgi:pimeloyl-ACP methyl ester carboxylesterase